MTAKLSNIVIDCAEPAELAQFWIQVLTGYAIDGDPSGDEVAISQGDTGLDILFIKVPEGKEVKNRLHLDLVPETTVSEEVAHLSELGASQKAVFKNWTVLQDPEGNEFCLVKNQQERDADKAAAATN